MLGTILGRIEEIVINNPVCAVVQMRNSSWDMPSLNTLDYRFSTGVQIDPLSSYYSSSSFSLFFLFTFFIKVKSESVWSASILSVQGENFYIYMFL